MLAKNFVVSWLGISDENLSISDLFESSTSLYIFDDSFNEYFMIFLTTIFLTCDISGWFL